MPPPELQSSQDMLTWKREYNIRQRESDWRRRQEEMLTQKQVMWQIQRCERDNRLAAAREARRKEELEKRVAQRHLEIERKYKERCRQVEIDKRAQTWEQTENTRLVDMHAQAEADKKAAEEKLAQAKSEKYEQLQQAAAARAEKKRMDEEINERRRQKILEREAARQMKGASLAQELKSDSIAKSSAVVTSFTEKTVGKQASTVISAIAQPAAAAA